MCGTGGIFIAFPAGALPPSGQVDGGTERRKDGSRRSPSLFPFLDDRDDDDDDDDDDEDDDDVFVVFRSIDGWREACRSAASSFRSIFLILCSPLSLSLSLSPSFLKD